jgi:hypothetical protein
MIFLKSNVETIKNIKNYDSNDGINFYLLIQGDQEKKLIETNINGYVTGVKELLKIDGAYPVNYVDIKVDGDYIYLLGIVGESIYSAREEKIYVYDKFFEKIDELKINQHDSPSEYKFKDLNVVDGKIYVLDKNIGNVFNVSDQKYIMEHGVWEPVYSFAMSSEEDFYIGSLRGNLFRYDGQQIDLIDFSEYDEKLVPNFLNINKDSKLCFLNSYNQDYYSYDDGTLKLLFNSYIFQDQYDGENKEFIHIKSFDGNTFMGIEKTGTGFIVVDEQSNYLISKYHYNFFYYIKYLLVFMLVFFFLIYGVSNTYEFILRKYKRIPIVLKQSLVVVIVLAIIFGVAGYIYIKNITNQKGQDTYVLLASIAIEKGHSVDVEKLMSLDYLGDYDTPKHKDLLKKFMPYILQEDVQREFLDSLYFHTYVLEDGELYIALSSDYMGYTNIDEIYGRETSEGYYEVVKQKVIGTGDTEDINGRWMVAVQPITDSSGEVVGLYEVGIDYDNYKYVIDSLLNKFISISMIAIVIIVAITITIITRPLRYLKSLSVVINKISSGDLSQKAEINSKDEFEVFARLINNMSENMKKYMDELYVINKSYSRFLPNSYLEMLGKNNVIDLMSGDNVSLSGYMLEITMDDAEHYEFYELNGKIEAIYQSVHGNGGVVIKNFENKIQVFFNESINIYDVLSNLDITLRGNNFENYMIVTDYGSINFGVVGSEERLFPTVITRQIDVINHIVDINKKYGLKNIFTQRVLEKNSVLSDVSRRFAYITLNESEIEIYENYSYDDYEVKKIKNNTKESFQKGIDGFKNQDMSQVQIHLLKVLKENPNDIIAKDIFFRSNQ